ncbi:adenylosuccinate synthetase [Fusarium oxysporum f. sp. lycopersici 4287]|uniref:Adenylosuccinate synthetase n=2 Tax=Fusarium oxysporum TaxID=5507 RepID=A0A0J9UY82_FUSO4|nr:adenylosuccinate synthetase [Fusarium oxysporum f. sp. lycopersici 4287]EXK35183.1 adenylosuccinate synthetase [Fusarium oxysporum f. sp. melonis 26406]KAJ9423640.1 adenylosuccinate synthetase [Fusarium oxysporum]KNB04254.1 adenylosuccinate synthetase [Fusarium oxysporum f. sp. lycopersici 4287]
MPITVILGAQWGDEGKGKLVDGQCQEAQLCARAAGGNNAGHLVRVNGVSYSFHLLPSGLINPRCMNFIGSGVVFHVPSFFSELKELEKNLTAVHDRILVSDRVNVLLDLHIAVDGLEEEELGDAAIGTTRRGIGPCYQTSRARTGIKMTDVFHPEVFEQKLRRLADGFQKRFGELLEYDIEAELARFDEYRQTLSKYVVDGVAFMRSVQESNMKIVIEGANALMLDVDYGSYPFVTSSSTTLAGIIGGLALNPKNITETVGVVKAYTTRVGAGAFKTEDIEEIGTKLQEIGREWGTSTGRRRRCGWLDLVVVKYSNSINYYDSLNLTKLDVLDTFETIKIAIAYKIDGEELDSYPADLEILNRAEVVYHEMPGWQKPTTNARTFYDLPRAARDYVEYIEKFVGVKIKYIGTGPDREAMIQRA